MFALSKFNKRGNLVRLAKQTYLTKNINKQKECVKGIKSSFFKNCNLLITGKSKISYEEPLRSSCKVSDCWKLLCRSGKHSTEPEEFWFMIGCLFKIQRAWLFDWSFILKQRGRYRKTLSIASRPLVTMLLFYAWLTRLASCRHKQTVSILIDILGSSVVYKNIGKRNENGL